MDSKTHLALGTLTGALFLMGCGTSGTWDGPVGTVPLLAPPIAVNDYYTARGNAEVITTAANGIFANDTPNSGRMVSTTPPSHGSLALQADGSFTYIPTTGFVGNDTFTYILANSAGNSTATVTFNLAGIAFFVNNQATAGGDGSQAHPFQTLAAAATAATGVSGAQIVVFQGDGTTTGLNTALSLSSGQSLVGFSASARPTLTGPVNFSQGNSLADLRIIGTTGTAVNASGAADGMLSGVTIANATGRGLDLTNATGTFSFNGGTVSNVPGQGALLSNCTAGNLSWTVSNSTFTNNTASVVGNITGTANQTVAFTGNTFTGGSGPAMYLGSDSNSTLATNVTGNTVTGGGTAANGLQIGLQGNSLLLARILSNTISGALTYGIVAEVAVNSTGKIRFENNLTTGNGALHGLDIGNAGTAQLFTTFTNNTSDQYNFTQSGTMNLVVENLAAFVTNNTGILNAVGSVVTAAGGSSGIP